MYTYLCTYACMYFSKPPGTQTVNYQHSRCGLTMSHRGNIHKNVFNLLESTVPRRLLEQQYPQQDIMRKVKMKNINTPQISMFDLLISYKSSTVL